MDGCRSSRRLEVHHLIHRADGGGHDASNLVLLCSACHLAHHRGALTISGTANELQIRRPGEAAATGTQDDPGGATGLPARAHVGAEPRPQGSMVKVDASVAACDWSPVVAPGAHVGAGPRPQGSMVKVDASVAACDWSPVVAPGVHVGAEPRLQGSRAGVDASSAAGGALTAADPDAHVGAGPRPQGSRAGVDASPAAGGTLTTADPDAHVGAMSSADPVEDTSGRAGGACRLDAAILRTQAKAALTGLGWKPAIAHAAVAAAAEAQGADVTLERLIFEALRRCPKPKT